jgi:hypothetical protein
MGKALLFLAALLAYDAVDAQIIENAPFTDNMFISVQSGVDGSLKPISNGYGNFGKSIQNYTTVRLGKWVNPCLGFELDGSVGLQKSPTFVEHSNIGVNALVNVNNLCHPFRGECDKTEFVPFLGIGWHHTYDYVSNNISCKFGGQVNFNFGSEKQWQFNIIPSFCYVLTNNKANRVTASKVGFDSKRAIVVLQVGFTYKFKNKSGSRNFDVSPYFYTQDEFDDLSNEVTRRDKVIISQENEIKALKQIISDKDKKLSEHNRVIKETLIYKEPNK